MRVERKGKNTLFVGEMLMIVSCLMVALAVSDELRVRPHPFLFFSENILEIMVFVLGLAFFLPASSQQLGALLFVNLVLN